MSTSHTAAGRRGAIKVVGLGVLLVGINVAMLVFDGTYFPVLMLFGVPTLLSGLAALVFPADYDSIGAPADPNALPTLPGARQDIPVGLVVILVAGVAGFLLGGYLMFRPDALFTWLGMEGAIGAATPPP